MKPVMPFPVFLSGTCGTEPIKRPTQHCWSVAEWHQVWPKKVDGIIRHGRFRSARASAFVSLPDKLATEEMYSNNEFFLPGRVKRKRTKGESGREGDFYRAWKSEKHPWISSSGILPLMNTNDEGGMMRPSIQAVILMPSECEKGADGFLHKTWPQPTILHMTDNQHPL